MTRYRWSPVLIAGVVVTIVGIQTALLIEASVAFVLGLLTWELRWRSRAW